MINNFFYFRLSIYCCLSLDLKKLIEKAIVNNFIWLAMMEIEFLFFNIEKLINFDNL